MPCIYLRKAGKGTALFDWDDATIEHIAQHGVAPEEAENITIVQSLDEIPEFAAEAEEHAYWGTHALSAELWARLPAPPDGELPPPRPRTRSIAIRFDDATLRRVKALAARRNTGYQTLLKECVIERLYKEEKRDGVIGK